MKQEEDEETEVEYGKKNIAVWDEEREEQEEEVEEVEGGRKLQLGVCGKVKQRSSGGRIRRLQSVINTAAVT